jgi:hypothetical protein
MMLEHSRAKLADKTLTHYITLALKESGCRVDSDTYAELDSLIQEAVEEAVIIAITRILQELNKVAQKIDQEGDQE